MTDIEQKLEIAGELFRAAITDKDQQKSYPDTKFPTARPTGFSVNLIEPGLSKWFNENVHQMTPQVARVKMYEYENMQIQYEAGNLPLTANDRLEIQNIVAILGRHLDDTLPKMPADITDHDRLSGFKSRDNWPVELPKSTLLMHQHFVELLHAWRLNNFRRKPDQYGMPTIDEWAESNGITRFYFNSKESRNDFLEFYGLDDFVSVALSSEPKVGPEGEEVWSLTLTNKFDRTTFEQFHITYRSAMNTLSVIAEERNRAVRNDGGKIGYLLIDHFSQREVYELTRIRQAREALVTSKGGE